jgi:hypothetical protein
MLSLFTFVGATREQVEILQHWQNGRAQEDPKQEGTRGNKKKGKYKCQKCISCYKLQVVAQTRDQIEIWILPSCLFWATS